MSERVWPKNPAGIFCAAVKPLQMAAAEMAAREQALLKLRIMCRTPEQYERAVAKAEKRAMEEPGTLFLSALHDVYEDALFSYFGVPAELLNGQEVYVQSQATKAKEKEEPHKEA